MKFKGIYLLFCLLFFYSSVFAQNDGSEVSRSQIFDRLEARAKSLATRMQEMVEQDSSPPVSPSNLPKDHSPSVFVPPSQTSPSLVPESDPVKSTRIDLKSPESPIPDDRTFTIVDEENEEYIPIASSQELNGDYYIMPSLGFVLTSESKVNYKFVGQQNEVKDLDNEIGSGVGIKAGIRLDNFFTEFGIKYTSSDFKIYGALPNNGPIYTGVGIVDILNFNARLGYTFQVNEQLSLSGSAGLGLANRKNSFDIDLGIGTNFNIGSSETVLSYDVGFSLCYLINENHLLSLGYNYANVAKISQFDALNLHYFELGWGINF